MKIYSTVDSNNCNRLAISDTGFTIGLQMNVNVPMMKKFGSF